MGPLRLRVRAIVRETPWSTLVRLDLGRAIFRFHAGQSAKLGRRPGTAGIYSIASSPGLARRTGALEFLIGHQPGEGAVSQLGDVSIGGTVRVAGPFGTFKLPRPLRDRRLLFIAGGTGIAPVRSMIQSVLAFRRPPATTLLYSAQSPDGFAFVHEFRQLSRAGRLRLRLTATRKAGETWRGRRGRIQRAWLRQLMRDGPTRCFVCGPPAFVANVSGMLTSLGVAPTRIERDEH